MANGIVTSETVVFHPIVAALVAAESIMGHNREWKACNPYQSQFLPYIASCRDEVAGIKELESIASWSREGIMSFLTERGFGDMKLEPFDPMTFGIASVLNLLLEWMNVGEEIDVTTPEGKKFEGVKIKGNGVAFFTSSVHDGVVVRLSTKSGDYVYLTMFDGFGSDKSAPFDLMAEIDLIDKSLMCCYEHDEVHFPMVNLDQDVDVSWLIGMEAIADFKILVCVSQALQKTRFKMNHKGAKVESAFAGAVTFRTCILEKNPPLIINKPFLAWVKRDGLSIPLFAGHIGQDCWENPGEFK